MTEITIKKIDLNTSIIQTRVFSHEQPNPIHIGIKELFKLVENLEKDESLDENELSKTLHLIDGHYVFRTFFMIYEFTIKNF